MVGWQEELPWLVVSKLLWQEQLPWLVVSNASTFRLVCKSWRNMHDEACPSLTLKFIRPEHQSPNTNPIFTRGILNLPTAELQRLFQRLLSLKHLHMMRGDDHQVKATLDVLPSLSNLTELRFTHCALNNQTLGVVCSLSKLTHLQISNHCSAVDDQALRDLSALTNLVVLAIPGARTLTNVSTLSSLTNLRRLNVAQCHSITTSVPPGLKVLPSLTAIDLSGCLTGGKPSQFFHKNCVQENRAAQADADLLALASLTELRSLHLRDCWDVSHVEHLASLSALTRLDLGFCYQISDTSMELLCIACPGVQSSLTSLSLVGTRLTTAGLSHLDKLTALQLLDLSVMEERVTSRTLHGLQALTRLRYLGLRGYYRSQHTEPDTEFCVRLASLTSLVSLSVSSNFHMDDTALTLLSQRMTKLKTLDLARCMNITDEGLQACSQLTAITSLNLAGLKISNHALEHVAKLTKLTKLSLQDCPEVTALGVHDLCNLLGLKLVKGWCRVLNPLDDPLDEMRIKDTPYRHFRLSAGGSYRGERI